MVVVPLVRFSLGFHFETEVSCLLGREVVASSLRATGSLRAFHQKQLHIHKRILSR